MGVEGATETGQELLGQQMHHLANPQRNTDGDQDALIQSFLGGAVGGAPFGALDAAHGYFKDKADGIVNRDRKINPNMTDGEAAAKLAEYDGKDVGEATTLAQDILNRPDASERQKRNAENFLKTQPNGDTALVFADDVRNTAEAERFEAVGKRWGEKLIDGMGEAFGYVKKRLGNAQGNSLPDDARFNDDAVIPTDEAIVDELVLNLRAQSVKQRNAAKADAALSLVEPLNRWMDYDFGARLNNGEPMVLDVVTDMLKKIDLTVNELYEAKVARGERVPDRSLLNRVIEEIALKEGADKGSLQQQVEANFDEDNQYDGEGEIAADNLLESAGIDSLNPETLGTKDAVHWAKGSDTYQTYDKADAKRMDADEQTLQARYPMAKVSRVGIVSHVRTKLSDKELEQAENQLLKDLGGLTDEDLVRLSNEEPQVRKNLLRKIDMEHEVLKTTTFDDKGPLELEPSDLRKLVAKTSYRADNGVVQFEDTPNHGVLYFRHVDGKNKPIAIRASKLIEHVRGDTKVSGPKELHDAVLTGASLVMDAYDKVYSDPSKPYERQHHILPEIGYKATPNGKIIWGDKLPSNLKLIGDVNESDVAADAREKFLKGDGRFERIALATTVEEKKEALREYAQSLSDFLSKLVPGTALGTFINPKAKKTKTYTAGTVAFMQGRADAAEAVASSGSVFKINSLYGQLRKGDDAVEKAGKESALSEETRLEEVVIATYKTKAGAENNVKDNGLEEVRKVAGKDGKAVYQIVTRKQVRHNQRKNITDEFQSTYVPTYSVKKVVGGYAVIRSSPGASAPEVGTSGKVQISRAEAVMARFKTEQEAKADAAERTNLVRDTSARDKYDTPIIGEMEEMGTEKRPGPRSLQEDNGVEERSYRDSDTGDEINPFSGTLENVENTKASDRAAVDSKIEWVKSALEKGIPSFMAKVSALQPSEPTKEGIEDLRNRLRAIAYAAQLLADKGSDRAGTVVGLMNSKFGGLIPVKNTGKAVATKPVTRAPAETQRLGNAQDDYSVIDKMVAEEDYALLTTVSRVRAFFKKALDRFEQLKGVERADEARWEKGEDELMTDSERQTLSEYYTLLSPQMYGGNDITDYESWFDGIEHTAADVQYVKDVYAKVASRSANAQQASPSILSEEDKAKVRAEIEKRLGKIVVEFLPEITGTVNGKEVKFSADWGPALINIAIGASNPMQMGMHEAMHELFYRLSKEPAGSQVLDKLKRAANNPLVVRQLERLLQDEPNSLLQIDPKTNKDYENERIAYMYQFWQADALQIGPETKTALQKIADFVRKLIGALSNDQQAELILQAFDGGQFASGETNVVAEVLMKQVESKRAFVESAIRLTKEPMDKLQRLAFTAHTILAESGYAELKEIADAFYMPEGEYGKQGMFEARKQMSAKFLNRMKNILQGASPADVNGAMEALLREDGVAPKDMKQYEIYRETRELLEEVHAYMTDANVMRLKELLNDAGKREWEKVPRRKNYFPVVWEVIGREGEFAAALVKHHSAEIQERMRELKMDRWNEPERQMEYAMAIAGRLARSNGGKDLGETGSELGFSPLMTAINQRSLDWITAPEIAQQFREQNLVSTMTNYVMQAVKRAEYVRSFDNGGKRVRDAMEKVYLNIVKDIASEQGLDGEKLKGYLKRRYIARLNNFEFNEEVPKGVDITKITEIETQALKKIAKYQNAIMAMEGTLGHDINPKLRELSAVMMVFQNFRLLTMTLFSSMSDPMGIMVRGGDLDDAFAAMRRGFKEVVKRWKDDTNVKGDTEVELAELLGTVDAGTFMETLGETYSSLYMGGKVKRANDALFKWNGMEAWNRGMRVSATQAAVKFIKKHMNTPTKHSERYLKELFGDNAVPELMDGELDYTNPLVQQAIMRWVDGAILSPNAAQRPMWASDPHYALLFHMKQFVYSFHKVILKRAFTEAFVHGDAGKLMVLFAGYVPVVIAADTAKSMLLSMGEEPYWMQQGVGSALGHGISRAALMGIPQIGLDAFSQRSRVDGGFVDSSLEVASSLAGPTTGWIKDWYDKPIDDQLFASLPGGNAITQVRNNMSSGDE
jgi:hypothetical protein